MENVAFGMADVELTDQLGKSGAKVCGKSGRKFCGQ